MTMGPLGYHLCSVLLISLSRLTLISGQAPPSNACRLTIPNIREVLKDNKRFFEKDSGILIIEYTVKFRNDSDENDFMKLTSNDSYQPLRWYRTQGQESSRLLLTYNVYLGIIRFILSFGIQSVHLDVDVSPPGCLQDLANVTVENLIRDLLLIDFEDSVNQEASSSKDVNICSARIPQNVSGEIDVVFCCCILESVNDKLIDCNDVEENQWCSLLYVIIVYVILFFPAFSLIESKEESSDDYIYTFPGNQNETFNILRTTNASYQNLHEPTLQEKSWKKIISFNHSLEFDTVYKMRVKRVTFDVPATRLFMEGERNIFGLRMLYDYLNAKMHNSEENKVEGNNKCYNFLKIFNCTLKTAVIIYALILIAIPSLPFVFAVSDRNLWYWQLAEKVTELSNQTPYPSLEAFKIYLAIIYSLYVLLPLVIIICGCDLGIEIFYRQMLEKNTVHFSFDKMYKKMSTRIINWCSSCCVWCLPFVLIVCVILYIVITSFSFLFNTIFSKFFLALLAVCEEDIRKKNDLPQNCFLWCFYKIIITLFRLSMLNVVFLGVIFLSVFFISVIILIVFEVNLFHNTIPLILVLLFYVLDSYKKISNKFERFIATLLDDKILKISDVSGRDSNNMISFGTRFVFRSLKVRQSKLCLEFKTPFLFVSKDGIKHISRNFVYKCSKMKSEGAPGALSENYLHETTKLMKIAFFLSFVYLIVMAYGSYVFISQNKYLMLTFIMGLVPLLRERLSNGHSDAKIGKGFHKELENKILDFSEEWTVKEMEVDFTVSDSSDGNVHLIIVQNDDAAPENVVYGSMNPLINAGV